MIIKSPEPRDIPRLRRLWQEAFGDDEAFLDGFFSTGFSPIKSRIVKIQDRPVAALYWFDCYLGDKKLAYIYAVATDKAYRGRGLCRALMAHTHKSLQLSGYSAAVLIPGSKKLFSMYDKLGYRAFCPMHWEEIFPAEQGFAVENLTSHDYFARRQALLPACGISQDSVAEYLETFTEFCGGKNWIACLTRLADSLYFQEFLGAAENLPGLVKSFGAATGKLCLPGGQPRAMFYSLDGTNLEGAYLGISLG